MTKPLSRRRATKGVPTLRPAMGAYQRELRRDIERARGRHARRVARCVQGRRPASPARFSRKRSRPG